MKIGWPRARGGGAWRLWIQVFIFGEHLDVVTGLKSFIPVSFLFGAAILNTPSQAFQLNAFLNDSAGIMAIDRVSIDPPELSLNWQTQDQRDHQFDNAAHKSFQYAVSTHTIQDASVLLIVSHGPCLCAPRASSNSLTRQRMNQCSSLFRQ